MECERVCTPRLEQLTMKYPVADSLGKLYTDLRERDVSQRAILNLLCESPAQNLETEVWMEYIIRAATQEGKWVGLATSWTPKDVEGFIAHGKTGWGDFGKGLDRAITAQVLQIEVSGKKVCISPGDKFVEFLIPRINQYKTK